MHNYITPEYLASPYPYEKTKFVFVVSALAGVSSITLPRIDSSQVFSYMILDHLTQILFNFFHLAPLLK